MERWRRRISFAIVAVGLIVLGYTLLYQWVMAAYEGIDVSFTHALRIVIESLTTAGFGGDTDYWTTTASDLLVMGMNLTGVLLVFLAIPLFGVPLFREAFDTSPPTSSDLTDHIIICGYSRRDEVLCTELDAAEIPYLYIDTDPEIVRSLNDQGISAIVGDSQQAETLRAANASEARGIVADINDEVNPTVILSARRTNPDCPIISVARRPGAAEYHRFAGADGVIEAPQALGESLGLRAVTSFAEMVRDALGDGETFQVTELLVEEDSELIGQTLRETTTFRDADLHVFGGWFGGKILIPPDPDVEIIENTILLVAGQYDASAMPTRQLPLHLDDRSRVLIAGGGAVGTAAAAEVEAHGNEYDLIDIDPAVDPDIVGDVTDPETFLDADVSNYRSVILALNQDPTTIYATLVLNQLAPDVEIIARVHDPDNVWKLYNAGADFVLSMSVITGEMLAADLIDDVEILTPHDEFAIVRTTPEELVGMTLAEADIRSMTGVTVLAVQRNGDILTEMGPQFAFHSGDTVVVAGRPAAVETFKEHFC